MLFNSLSFLVFFPVVTALYYLLPSQYRWLQLLISSCIFYCAFVPSYILILFFTITIDYFAGIWIEEAKGSQRKWLLALSIVANIGVLAVFKYYNFFIDNLDFLFPNQHWTAERLNMILPIGLSFHTFQAMSYTIEVYRKNQPAERHFGIYALYVMFYPQLVAGPIERPQNILPQLHGHHPLVGENISQGLKLMAWGMFKKVVIADRLAAFCDPVFNHPQEHNAFTLGIACFFFCFQIFCDFSGYSDIALGSAQVMGFRLMKNFDRPYASTSISEFWSRWHISLSTWFRDYLYIPLGGNRVSVPRWYFNLFFVFLVSGFWHGASWTFVAWGAIHGLYLIGEIILKPIFSSTPLPSPIRKLATFGLVMLAWIFFRANSIQDAFYILGQLPQFPEQAIHFIQNPALFTLPLSHHHLYLSLWLILFLESVHYIGGKHSIDEDFRHLPIGVRWLIYYAAIFAIMMLGVFESRNFIYFQF